MAVAVIAFGTLACQSGGAGGPTASGGAGQGGSSASVGGSLNKGGREGTGGGIGTGGATGGAGSGGARSDGNVTAGSGAGTSTFPAGGRLATGGGSASGGTSGLGGATGSGGGIARDGGAGQTGGSGGSTSATCTGKTKPTEGKKTVMVGSTSRSYYLHIPANCDVAKPAPLLVDFHGLGGNGTSEEQSSPYRSVIDAEGVVSAYPDGVQGTNGTGWNMGPCCTTVDDVAFAKALVQDVAKLACIDLKRVYAVGFSLGGGMVHYLGCMAADVFAAIAPAASDLAQQNLASCQPPRPITELSFRGTADTAVPYGGGNLAGIQSIGAQATFEKWAAIDQCTGSPSAADSNGCSTYASCAGGVQVTLCTKQGGGHEPGNANVGWPILKKYSLP